MTLIHTLMCFTLILVLIQEHPILFGWLRHTQSQLYLKWLYLRIPGSLQKWWSTNPFQSFHCQTPVISRPARESQSDLPKRNNNALTPVHNMIKEMHAPSHYMYVCYKSRGLYIYPTLCCLLFVSELPCWQDTVYHHQQRSIQAADFAFWCPSGLSPRSQVVLHLYGSAWKYHWKARS